MARGSRTPDNVELEFRKHYLVTGNISASARAVGLSVPTAWGLAQKAQEDPEFKQARHAMRARLLPDATSMLRTGMEVAHERLLEPAPSPERIAQIAVENGLKSFSFQDVRPAYFKSVVDAVKVIGGLDRLEAEKRGDISTGPAVVIHMTPDTDGEPEPPA